MARRPHKLDLYRLAVQHPLAEAAFIERAHRCGGGGRPLRVLKEDFAGGAALAATWVQLDAAHHRAVAVDSHGPTLRWGQRRAESELGPSVSRVQFVHDDVVNVTTPRVDAIAALNFSVFIYHEPAALEGYFRAARTSLRAGGVLVVDAYGGPGAMQPMLQRRRVVPGAVAEPHEAVGPFEYQWEQRSYDAATNRVDNRIHFRVGRQRYNNAFRYDWRLWTLPELCQTMLQAGFRQATIWCDRYDPTSGISDGIYRSTRTIPNRRDWVAYVVGAR
jgi:SAM-dependent methyltransferase